MRTLSIATATTLAALLMSVGCGSTEDPDGAIIIIMDDGTVPTSTNSSPVANTNNATSPANNTTSDTNNAPTTTGPTNNSTTVPPEDTNNETTIEEPPEPCGNGVLDNGEMCDGNCPTSCDDGDPCTQGTLSGAAAACTSVCAYQADSACDAWEGAYSGTYYIKAEEKVGSSVINSMTCTGTFTADVDMSRADNLMGTANCTYGGSLSIFDSSQSATITGNIAPDGTFTARIQHDSGAPNNGNFNVSGSLVGGSLTVDDTGSYRPHPQSAVGWETVIQLD